MPTDILFNQNFSHKDLDDYLAAGWRALGQRVYNCEWLQLEPGDITSVLPTRLVLQDYAFSKSMRKLWRRNSKEFRVEVGQKAFISVQKERINNLYGLIAPDKKLDQLDYHLLYQGQKMLDTRECRIFLNDELVAFSWFDRGEQAMYSKVGIYNPRYKQHSLGLYSMLVEINHAQSLGMDYYYPGYVSPQVPAFNYKHRIGPLEYRDPMTETWRPWSDFDQTKEHLQFVHQSLEAAQRAFQKARMSPQLLRYPFYSLRLHDEFRHQANLLDTPAILLLHKESGTRFYLVYIHLARQTYRLVECYSDQFIPAFFPRLPNAYPITHRILLENTCLLETEDLKTLVAFWAKVNQNAN